MARTEPARRARPASWPFAALVALVALATFAAEAEPDPWRPVRFLAGVWQGTVTGASGNGTVEVHRHIGYLSYDRKRDALVLRQFHQESFVNTYVMNRAQSRPGLLVFESEAFENFDNAWKAKETYEIVSMDEFVETFELATPGKPFVVYSRNHFRRVR